MNEITIKAYAKINLSLDVLGKRPDGYHEVLMVMEQIDLYDTVTVAWLEDEGGSPGSSPDDSSGISLSTNLPYLPTDGRNIAYKAAELMAERYGRKAAEAMAGQHGKDTAGRIEIEIFKRIPVAAGLAGGSANCAAVLHALNRLWDLKLDLEALMKIGAELGADVPFCLAGQAALNRALDLKAEPLAVTCAVASGIGERLEPAPPMNAWVLLSKPSISVSTAQVYGGLDLRDIREHPDTEKLVAGLKERNFLKISKNMVNVLENYSLKEYPVIMYTKNKIVTEGKAYQALMSGSGPTVFGLYTSKRKGTAAYSKLKTLNKETFLVKTL